MKMKKTLTIIFLSFFVICSCEQPFKAGLGGVIDLQAPAVVLESPNPKLLYIRGVVDFTGYATDDYKLESVWFQISNYPAVDLSNHNDPYMPKYRKMKRNEGVFYKVENRGGNDRYQDWKFTINTKMETAPGERAFLEGTHFKIRMLAIDSVGKEAITDEIVYIIKNERPQIAMTFPAILPGEAPGDIGGSFLNYGFLDGFGFDEEFPDKTKPGQFPRWMTTESYMSGTISDDQEINFTREGTDVIIDKQGNQQTVELFTPQIRFWQVDISEPWTGGDGKIEGRTDSNGDPVKIFQMGYFPSDDENGVPWEKLGGSEQNQLLASGLQNATFLYKLPKESGTSYGFEVRAQSNDTLHSTVRYPHDYIAKLDPDNPSYDPSAPNYPHIQIENAYVLITLREPQEFPILELYGLQYIKDGTTPYDPVKGMLYKRVPKDEITGQLIGDDADPGDIVEKDGNHSYVDKDIVNKGGPFILRMKASHSGGIKSAVVYWEKDDNKSYKGRFIWDPVDFSTHNSWPPAELGEPVPTSAPYEEWGFREPRPDNRVRSFVYTYHDDPAKDVIPNSATGVPSVKGKSNSTVHWYTGPSVDDENKPYDFDQLPEKDENNGSSYWEGLSEKLPEGTYNLYIYARSNSGSRVTVPYTVTIKIDREMEPIDLLYIDGSAGEDDKTGNLIVNGVIRPTFRISDSRAVDSGVRTGSTPYFARPSPDTGYYPEQMYFVVGANGSSTAKDNMEAMNLYLKLNPGWPDINAIKSAGYAIKKDGPIFDDNTCLFRTSYIYDDKSDKPYELEDGIYYLYAFARDNAFNVGSLEEPYLIEVRRSSDDPTFEFFDPVDERVISPDWSYDLGGDYYTPPTKEKPDSEESFITADGVRNKFSANSSIRVRIKDDDSLDLGVKGVGAIPDEPSMITVTFMGSRPDPVTGEIKPYETSPGSGVDDPAYLMKLGDDEKKAIFGTQSTYSGYDEELPPPGTGTLRRAVKDVTGIITQTALLNLLKANSNYDSLFGIPSGTLPADALAIKAGFNSLPDGIYRVGISIQDYTHPSIKLKMPEPLPAPSFTARADINTQKRTFWIAVDTKAPGIDITEGDGPGKTKPSGSYISSSVNEPADLVGFVSDENGPITFVGWEIYGESPTGRILYSSSEGGRGPDRPDLSKDPPFLKTPCPPSDWAGKTVPTYWWGNSTKWWKGALPSYTAGKWQYEFDDFQMNLNDNEGTFTFVLKFKDRFGNTATMSRKYSVDKEPPKVSISRKIETFERVEDDVYLDNRITLAGWDYTWDPSNYSLADLNTMGYKSYVQLDSTKAGQDNNKTRLAVKVVNFTINPTDNFRVEGVRWWLLPANVGSRKINNSADPGAFDSSGQVLDYNAFPAKETNFNKAGVYYSDGQYYNSSMDPSTLGWPTSAWGPHGSAGFDKGAYGVVDVAERKFTIAVDTERMAPANGEYRLHIIAIDAAGNTSAYNADLTLKDDNILQEVFFLQEEDRPYFGSRFLKDENGVTIPGKINDNITPGVRVEGAASPWPSNAKVLGSTPIIRGTIWDNNGFSRKDDADKKFWDGSISVWFSKTGAAPPTGIVPSGWNETYWEYLVSTDSSLGAGWEGPKTVPGVPPNGIPGGLGSQNRNISLGIALTDLFPEGLKDDGDKRYIIKATDSPYNKLSKTTGAALGTGVPMGTAEDIASRVSRSRQYAFVYDAQPPVITVTSPKAPDDKFGTNLADPATGFILKGTISDKNLANMTYYYQETDPAYISNPADDNKYYFEYYLDNNTSARDLFILDGTVPGITITVTPANATDPLKVDFVIQPSVVTAQIIPKAKFESDDFAEGQHTLNLFAFDKSGKEGAAMVYFTKDMKPPSVSFTTLDEKPYDETNKSIVNDWWTLDQAARQPLVFVTSNVPAIPAVPRVPPLPAIPAVPSHELSLTTIYYDSNEVPTISGAIMDTVSDIDISTFKYWFDNQSTTFTAANAVIEGSGMSVRWTIYLTKDGTKTGPKLEDGIHTIILEVADNANNKNELHYQVAFRVDSKPPVATITGFSGALAGGGVVYGDVRWQDDPIFSINLEGEDANLKELELIITDQAGNKPVPAVKFTPSTTPLNTTGSWIYTPFDYPPQIPTLKTSDNITFTGSSNIQQSAFTSAPSGDYEVVLVARDHANNESEQVRETFTYDKTSPEIEFTNPPNDNPAIGDNLPPQKFIDPTDPSNTNIPGLHRLTSEQLKIEGMIKDDFSAIRQVQSQVEKWNWETGGWEIIESWKNVRDDLYKIVDPGDPSKNTINTLRQISWTKNLLGQDGGLDLTNPTTWTPAGPAGPISAEGLYRIRIRAKDASYIKNSRDDLDYTDNNWVYPLTPASTPYPDRGNPVESPYVYFFYDRTNPELKITNINKAGTAMQTYYSMPAGGFEFEGTVKDANRFAKVEVVMQATGADPISGTVTLTNTVNTSQAPDLDRGDETQNWKALFNNSALADGRYKVTVTVYDMTGKSAKEEKSFILDATNPGMKFTGPAKARDKGFGVDQDTPPSPDDKFASVIVSGGETSVITGETWDKSSNSSESGVDQMWFHLGFIDNTTYTTANPFPTKATIEADELAILKKFAMAADATLTDAQAEAKVKAMTPTERNAAMDDVAKYTATTYAGVTDPNNDPKGNAWFKLGGSGFPRPTGFVINNPNIYDWRMEIPNHFPASEIGAADLAAMGLTTSPDKDGIVGYAIGGLKLYGKEIKVKGRTYSVGPAVTDRQMVRSVDGQAGIYRLPLWVRLVDKVGNVEYGCHDIWIYPDGDIPTTTIESPSNGSQNTARGGAISVDGVARSNTSVYDVIFRVFADDVPDTDLDGTKNIGTGTPKTGGVANPSQTAYDHNNNWVRITGYDPADSASIALLPAAYKPLPTATWTWQKANLTLPGGAGEPLIPWSIMLNSGDKITDLIKDRGFPAGSPDKIRVWMEVFVFNGEGSPIRSSIYANDLLNTANGALYGTPDTNGGDPGPRPYVKAFYIKSAAPAITHPNVGSWSTTAPNANQFVYRYDDPSNSDSANYGYKGAGTETRRDKFALKAILDPSGKSGTGYALGEISYRVKLDGGSYNTWTTLWKTGDTTITTTVPYEKDGIRIIQRGEAGRTRYDFVYAFASRYVPPAPPAAPAPNYQEGGTTFAPVNGGLWANSGGTITVQVRIKDTASPPNEAEQVIQVSVDNFAPVAAFDSAGNELERTNSKVAGTNVDFMGRVFDYANPASPLPSGAFSDAMTTEHTPRKAAKVYAWFTKTVKVDGVDTEHYVNINTGARAATPASGLRTMSVLEGRKGTVTYDGSGTDKIKDITLTNRGTVNTSRELPTLGTQAAHNADWVREISEATATPGSRMLWSPVNSAVYDIRWSFNIDTTVLPDGKMTLHYIVEDAAVVTIMDSTGKVVVLEIPGNASYYTQEVSVRNHYPQIDKVTLYTDNNGIGAVYTTHTSNNIASTEYDLNDYRNKMFANYTDPADYTAWNPSGLHDPVKDKLDKVGYLNSGFISKNQYIGFKVETSYGNRDLNFRLQYVERERLVLNSTTLNQMVTDKNLKDPTKINLYTIAWHGDYSNAKWKALGVPIDNPRLGTHFVFNPSNDFNVANAVGTAEVWKYTAKKTRTTVTPAGQPADDAVVFGPDNRFEFNVANTGEGDFSLIPELMGSHPDADDSVADNPKKTAFFLIRVWDTVNPPTTNGDEGWVNEQLYDALVVGMNVYLTDNTRPTVRLYDLNPYAETAVVGNNIGDSTDPVFSGTIANTELTIRNALDPRGIGQNILRGGLYNTKTERELVKSGHIEPHSATPPPTNPNAAYNGSALHPRIKNPITRVYETFEADGLMEGDSETNTYYNGTGWVTVTRDLVSGKIILRGSAWDDQLIREIRVRIGNTTETAPPASLYTISDKTNTILELDISGTPSTNSNYLTMKPSYVSGASGPRKQAWAAEELHWKTGHTVEWAYVWDTEKVPAANNGAPASDIKVWVAVIDQLGNNKVGLANAKDNTSNSVTDGYAQITADNETEAIEAKRFKNTITVAIVPYITGIERDPTKYATKRSLQGWYSFFQGEPNVSIVGYNLRGTTMANPAVRIQTGASTYTNPAITGTPTINRITFTVPTDAASGKILLYTSATVDGSTEALNHRSDDKQSWNRESHYFTDGSDLWINKPYAHIWRTQQNTPGTITPTGQRDHSTEAPLTFMGTTNSSGTTGSMNLTHPGMALEYNNGTGNNPGRLHGTWQVYGYANSFYGHNNNVSRNLVNGNPPGEPYATPDISIYNGGVLYNNNDTTVANIGFTYQGDGNPTLFIRALVNATPIAEFSNNHANIMYRLGENNPTQSFQNVRISKAAANTNTTEVNVGRIYMTAFNAKNNNLWYGSRDGGTITNLVIDGATGGPNRINDTGNGLGPATSAGQFSAIDYDATGPIIAYYDQEHDTLRIALGLAATPNNGSNQWNRKYVLASTHPLYRGSGRYVSIKVDKSGGIHLAFYNSTRSTVVYAYAASRNANFEAYAVDDVIKGGTWTDISVDNNGNPWIVYGDSTRTGNYDGARMAYRSKNPITGTLSGIEFKRDRPDAVGADITGWEAVSMPANYSINNDRLNIEAWPPTDRRNPAGTFTTGPGWNAAIGYASDMFRIGYFYYPNFKDGNY